MALPSKLKDRSPDTRPFNSIFYSKLHRVKSRLAAVPMAYPTGARRRFREISIPSFLLALTEWGSIAAKSMTSL
jgi:hypothetical protein